MLFINQLENTCFLSDEVRKTAKDSVIAESLAEFFYHPKTT